MTNITDLFSIYVGQPAELMTTVALLYIFFVEMCLQSRRLRFLSFKRNLQTDDGFTK